MKKVLKWSAIGAGLFFAGLAGAVVIGAREASKAAEQYDS